MRLIALFLLLPLLSGCISAAHKLDASAIAQIKEGTSTRSEIEARFGKPPISLTGTNSKTVGSYFFFIDSPPSPNFAHTLYFRSLSVLYDHNNVVEKFVRYESNETVHESVTALTLGSPTGRTAWIKRGETTAKYIIGLRGPPDLKSLTPDGQVVMEWLYAKRRRGEKINVDTEKFYLLLNEQGVVLDYKLQNASVPAPLTSAFGFNAWP